MPQIDPHDHAKNQKKRVKLVLNASVIQLTAQGKEYFPILK